ncbi:MAG: UxaA family hydrolase [Verrucomicrobia bacterium]|nr:UxaA family hydrolase [Verrucomicrobiota bacterium]
MPEPITLEAVGRIPFPGDNAAIASRRLQAGTEIQGPNGSFCLPHCVLEGHRFAIQPISTGESLLSWELPFGIALREIVAGEYVCNSKILQALRNRRLDFPLPNSHNFDDQLVRYELDEGMFIPGTQVARFEDQRQFMGFDRGEMRGVGTRNFVVVLGTSSRTASFARSLCQQFPDVVSAFQQIDGVVPVAHTEGGGASSPNNFEFVLRTLAGFVVHPNVGAILIVDSGAEPVNNVLFRDYLSEHHYPIGAVPHHFLTVGSDYQASLREGETIVRSWLERVDSFRRSPQGAEDLRFALQCGGSDAFSGVSGNPLAGLVAKTLIQFGGSANLAETDELIGAEPYVLRNVRDVETARRFLRTLERFQERAAWHGHDAEGNPSGGNNFRGLYNIAIKSIGAARKKDPEVCLDFVINYGERMKEPGFYFMDSPGNDLESVAGQVASGCNVILFTTGNGSITNFPFVPTIKIMTSTTRYALLRNEMDVNAGRYQDGTPMETLGKEVFELALQVAAGTRTAGEKAGHSQVQIWRDWRQTSGESVARIRQRPRPNGEPLLLQVRSVVGNDSAVNAPGETDRNSDHSTPEPGAHPRFQVFEAENRFSSDRVGLILPTSLCAGQVARMIATKLNRDPVFEGLDFVALPHTEGCGASGGESEQLFMRTISGYLNHPFTACALLLEHGCEKTHNDAMRECLERSGMDGGRFGWASIQLDGGIESVTSKVIDWFRKSLAASPKPILREVGIEQLQIGLTASTRIPNVVSMAVAKLAVWIVSSGGVVVIPSASALVGPQSCLEVLTGFARPDPSISYGEVFQKRGLHLMESPTDHHVEILTGLGATGVETIVSVGGNTALQGHPMIPVLQIGVGSDKENVSRMQVDWDWVVDVHNGNASEIAEDLLQRIIRVAGREYRPKALIQGNTDFQMTRGWLGVSL